MWEALSFAVMVSSLTSVERALGALNFKFLLFRIRFKEKCFFPVIEPGSILEDKVVLVGLLSSANQCVKNNFRDYVLNLRP